MTALQLASSREAETAFPPFKKSPTARQLGERIRTARTRYRLSQGDISLRLGLAKQTISQWENGDCTPQLKHLIQLAANLGIDPAYFLTGLSDDLKPTAEAQRRLDIASQVVPLYDIETAGAILMQKVDPKDVRVARHVPTLGRHPPRALAFEIKGDAMVSNQPGPSFGDGEFVTLAPATMAKRGQFVLAQADGAFHFRRFLPRVEGKVEDAILRALNPDFQDVVMGKGDAILGVLKEHIRHY